MASVGKNERGKLISCRNSQLFGKRKVKHTNNSYLLAVTKHQRPRSNLHIKPEPGSTVLDDTGEMWTVNSFGTLSKVFHE